MDKQQLTRIKILVGQFYEETKNNSVTDLIIWLDCKLEYYDHKYKQMVKK